MNLTCSEQEIEFRDHSGRDHTLTVDLWTDIGGTRAILVLRNLHRNEVELLEHAHAALQVMNQDWLPYLLRPEAKVLVLVLRPEQLNRKARAVVLPLSA